MNELIAQLKELGLPEYEAKAYTALVQNSNVSAYQVSKNSEIPRARIYDILNSLVEKGFVLKEETAHQTTYSSIPIDVGRYVRCLTRGYSRGILACGDAWHYLIYRGTSDIYRSA